MFVNLQGPATQASDHAGFLYNVARGMARSAERQRGLILPVLKRELLQADPFTCFDEWLDEVEKALKARQLVERPVKGFALRYEAEASQRVLDLTRGHPALVQLLCAEVVALKNEQPLARRRLATLADVEASVAEALGHGSFFFADIEQNQVGSAGLALLRYLATWGEGGEVSREMLVEQFAGSDELDSALKQALQRELIESTDKGYRFQVELIRRWFVSGGLTVG